ncbi:MAG: hypothetical protein ACRDQU_13100 [Pseudonocardiaceae bacterium]
MTEEVHRPGYVQDLKTGLFTAECQCGWKGPGPARMSQEHLAAMDATISAHIEDNIHPVVQAKLDELIETGDSRGVTPELMDDVLGIIGRP